MSLETDLRFRLFEKAEADPSRIPGWSARGCTQILTLLSHTELRRTVNGELIDVSSPLHRKYTSVITCQDKNPLAFDGVWIGSALWVDCIQPLIAPFSLGEQRITLARKPVNGSVHVEELKIKKVEDQMIVLTKKAEKPGFITYQPQLLMRLTDFHLQTDEWGMAAGWKMSLEEV